MKVIRIPLLLPGFMLMATELVIALPCPMHPDITQQPIETRRGPRPAILPGAGLDTALTKLPAQDPAVHQVVPAWLKSSMPGTPTYVINGKVATVAQLKGLRTDDVLSVNTLDGKRAVLRYGANARNGLVLITTKQE